MVIDMDLDRQGGLGWESLRNELNDISNAFKWNLVYISHTYGMQQLLQLSIYL